MSPTLGARRQEARRDQVADLGLRGLRASLRYPAVLQTQLRAITRVEPQSQCRILLPMVTEPDEIRRVRRMLDALRNAVSDALERKRRLGQYAVIWQDADSGAQLPPVSICTSRTLWMRSAPPTTTRSPWSACRRRSSGVSRHCSIA
mgnify:CR=1 FL=1